MGVRVLLIAPSKTKAGALGDDQSRVFERFYQVNKEKAATVEARA